MKLLRTYAMFLLVVIFQPLGNLSLAWGAKHFPQSLSQNPWAGLRAAFDPFIALGIALLILALLTRLALLSRADLSFVLPVTAIAYVVSALLGKIFLHERVSPERWIGIVLICLGTLLVGSTTHNTTVFEESI
jgi:drug/metabolite transporter (DMT)-like permease